MVNAQEWLNKEYSLEKRTEITDLNINSKDLEGELKLTGFFKLKKLDCAWNKLIDLDLSNCHELTWIECQGNLLTSTSFLATLPSPQKLTFLYMGENDFVEQDLSFLRPFMNLEFLRIWNSHQNRINNGLINRFHGSLKYLRNMKNLKQLGIGNTDVDSGLEYLAESKLETFPSNWYPWGDNNEFSGKINGAKAEKLFAELRPYAIDLKKGKYDFSSWKNAKIIELSLEVEKWQNQFNNQEEQINTLIEDLKLIGDDFLSKKREELATLINSIKEKLDGSLHGYLEIFLDAQTGNNTIEIIKKSLHDKTDEKELNQLSALKAEIIRLEKQLTNLQNQGQQQIQIAQIIQLPPK